MVPVQQSSRIPISEEWEAPAIQPLAELLPRAIGTLNRLALERAERAQDATLILARIDGATSSHSRRSMWNA